MSKRSSPPRIARKPAPRVIAANIRLPHPSWRLSGDSELTRRSITAEDFWQKLGL
jgi:hypothetical protein